MALKKAGLTTLKNEIRDACDRGVATAAGFVKDLGEQLAPYDSEADHKHLNESFEVRGTPGSMARHVVAGVGLPDQRAPAQEFGTIDSPAQPYLTPAADAIDIGQEVAAEVNKLIRRLAP